MYHLSHAYDCFLGTSILYTYCAKNRMKKNDVFIILLMKTSGGSRSVKVIDEFNCEL